MTFGRVQLVKNKILRFMPQPGRERTQRTRSRFHRQARDNGARRCFQCFRSTDTFQNKCHLKYYYGVNGFIPAPCDYTHFAYSLVCVYLCNYLPHSSLEGDLRGLP